MVVCLFLFAVGFANEALLTSYYVNAAKGKRWLCVCLSLSQQLVSFWATWFTLVDVEMGSKEQIIRFIVTALSYGCATAFIVKPIKEVKNLEQIINV